MRRAVAPAFIALAALIIQPVASAAAQSAPISNRFATYEKITPPTGGAQVQINATLPPGFGSAEIRARVASGGTLTNDQLFQVSASDPNAMKFSPMRDFVTEGRSVIGDSSDRYLRLTGYQRLEEYVFSFASEIPAGHLVMNFLDNDYEKIEVTFEAADGSKISSLADVGFQGFYDSQNGDPPGSGVNLPDISFSGTTLTVDGKSRNNDFLHLWFIPQAPIKTLTIVSTQSSSTSVPGAYFLWLAAVRPTPTITPTPQVPTTYTLGSNPIAITPEMFVGSFLPGILVNDFGTSPDLQFRVADGGGTGCTLSTTSPLTFTATKAGTCTVESFIAETADYKSASYQFPITVTSPPSPKPPTPTEWNPETTTFQIDTFPGVIDLPPPPNPPGGGSYTFTTHGDSTSLCTVDRDTPTITVPQPGTCIVTATIGETKNFARASITVEFTITGGPMLAATGAPAWPAWAAALALVGVGIVAAGHLRRHQHGWSR